MNRPSAVRYVPTIGLGVSVRSRRGSRSTPNRPAARRGPVAHIAVARSELSTMTASPVRSRWKSAAEIPPAIVARRSRRRRRGPVGRSGSRRRVRDDVRGPAAAPEGGPVVPTHFGVGTPLTLARTPHVNDGRVDGADVLDVDGQLATRLRAEMARNTSAVADSSRRILRPSAEPRSRPTERFPLFGSSIMWATPPGPVGTSPEAARPRSGVPTLRMLDLDDVGAPLGQHRPRNRDVRPRRHLDDLDAIHNSHGCSVPP